MVLRKKKEPVVIKKFKYQLGRTDKEKDALILNALRPGKRISKTGKTYWESRRNRSDLTSKGL